MDFYININLKFFFVEMKRKSFVSVLLFLLISFLIPSSIFAQEIITITNISNEPKTISPDNDGTDDFTVITATVGINGFPSRHPLNADCSVSILDSNGLGIRNMSKKLTIENNSSVPLGAVWDGTNNAGEVVPNGRYFCRISVRIKKVMSEDEGAQIDVFVQQILSVSVNPDNWDIGQIDPGETVEMSHNEGITVNNDGNIKCTYSLNLINPTEWQASQTGPGNNIYVLNAAFASKPKKIIWAELYHALSIEPKLCTDSRFAADETGTDVPPGGNRFLWLEFKSPLSVSSEEKQEIIVIITANPE